MNTLQFQAGLERLAQPILPLIRLVQLLFLTGPFSTVREVVAELNEPIETSVRYQEPTKALAPYLDLMDEFAGLKDLAMAKYAIFDAAGIQLPPLAALDLWVAQQVVERELESINSLLCGPCQCSLCCTGPSLEQHQVFFEIPLDSTEIGLFGLPEIDSPETRVLTSESEPALLIEGRAFYDQEPAIYRWRSGWSLILPRNGSCPHLQTSLACAIYPKRPKVCRRPQIFAYVLDRIKGAAGNTTNGAIPAYQSHEKILAIWDCPYVKRFQDKIAAYAELCDLEPIFKENKQ